MSNQRKTTPNQKMIAVLKHTLQKLQELSGPEVDAFTVTDILADFQDGLRQLVDIRHQAWQILTVFTGQSIRQNRVSARQMAWYINRIKDLSAVLENQAHPQVEKIIEHVASRQIKPVCLLADTSHHLDIDVTAITHSATVRLRGLQV
jgi:hypothetical protein